MEIERQKTNPEDESLVLEKINKIEKSLATINNKKLDSLLESGVKVGITTDIYTSEELL